jgi:hypothetical protein
MEDMRIFLKIYAPHSLITTYRINLISAVSISLDSAFKKGSVKITGLSSSSILLKDCNRCNDDLADGSYT